MKPRVLCVDDEPAVLEALQRNLRRDFDVSVDGSGAAALLRLSRERFEVIVSDMRMPGMDGAAFLARAREVAPDAVRMLLTGHADVDSAMAAVNDGHVFRFLSKPCKSHDLIAALKAGVRQYELVNAERTLLEHTLRGSVEALVQVLSLTSPESFGRAQRVKELARLIAERANVGERWSLEVAAMLSELGCIVVPPEVMTAAYRGGALTAEEKGMIERGPEILDGIISRIPRLESVRAALKYQDKGYDGSGKPADRVSGDAIPVHARVLKIARDFDTATLAGADGAEALAQLRRRGEEYDPRLLDVLTEARSSKPEGTVLRELPLARLQAGMRVAADVCTNTGILLVARGQVVTAEMLERLRNTAIRMGIVQPILCEVEAS